MPAQRYANLIFETGTGPSYDDFKGLALMNVVYVCNDENSGHESMEWRCMIPAQAINRTARHRAEIVALDDFAACSPPALKVCGQADMIIISGKFFRPALAVMHYWQSRGKVLVADIDSADDGLIPVGEDYDLSGQTIGMGHYKSSVRHNPATIEQLQWATRLVDGVTVASRRLFDDWSFLAKVFYLPNYIPLDPYVNAAAVRDPAVVIGWGSPGEIERCLNSPAIEAIQRICKVRSQVKLMLPGAGSNTAKLLELPPNQVIVPPKSPYQQRGQILAKFDIGIAPLSGPGGDRSGWEAVLEYLVMKVPWVASDGAPYQDLRSYGWLVKNTSNAWERILLDMIDHLEEYRQEASRGPYIFGLSKNIDENIDHILAVYSEIAALASDQHKKTNSAAQALSFINGGPV